MNAALWVVYYVRGQWNPRFSLADYILYLVRLLIYDLLLISFATPDKLLDRFIMILTDWILTDLLQSFAQRLNDLTNVNLCDKHCWTYS